MSTREDGTTLNPASTDGNTGLRVQTMEIMAWAMIVFGAIVRIRQYLGARSLRYDEARVAYEIADRSLLQMLDAAGFIRVAPPGWFVLEKLSIMALGTGELALRLVPLVAGLIALPLFWIVARRYLGDRVALVCVALGAVSEHVVYYASEVKQYSSDVTWCLLVLLAVQPLLDGSARQRRPWIFAGIVGIAALWFSQPALFVMAAAGIVLLVQTLRARRAEIKRVLALGSAWVASLVINYVFILSTQAGRDDLINYWRNGFPPLVDVPGAQIRWLNTQLYAFVDMPMGLASFGLVVFATAVGFIALLRRKPALASVIALVFLLAMIAATLRRYPFEGRLLLFSVPLILIVIATAVDQLNSTGGWRFVRPGMLLLALLIASPLVRATRMIVRPEGREEIKAVVNYAADRMEANDGMYLGRSSLGAYEWYTTWTNALRNPQDRTIVGADVGIGADSIRAEIESMRQYRRLWMVFVDYWPQDVAAVLDIVDPMAIRRDEFAAEGAVAYLYEFNTAVDSTGTVR